MRGYTGKAGLALAALTAAGIVFSAPALAAECPSTATLQDAPFFTTFQDYVREEYDPDVPFDAYAIGHAYGRVASAIGDDPERQVVFACLEVALEQYAERVKRYAGRDRVYPPDIDQTPNEAVRTMQAAAMGMHDDKVAERTGVTDTSPAETYFALLPPDVLTTRPSISKGASGNIADGLVGRWRIEKFYSLEQNDWVVLPGEVNFWIEFASGGNYETDGFVHAKGRWRIGEDGETLILTTDEFFDDDTGKFEKLTVKTDPRSRVVEKLEGDELVMLEDSAEVSRILYRRVN